MLHLELTIFAPDPRRVQRTGLSETEATELARSAAAAPAAALLIEDGARGHGVFFLWLSGDRALVRIDDPVEWYAADPALAPDGDGDVAFRDDDGSTFRQPLTRTLSRAQALDALAHWLRTRARTGALEWE